MSTYEDDGPDLGAEETELDFSGLDDDEPLSLDDDDDFSEED